MATLHGIYATKNEELDEETMRESKIFQYSLPEDSRMSELLIADNQHEDGECHSITFEERGNFDLVARLEEMDGIDMIRDAEVSYRTREDQMMGRAGTRKEHAFLSDQDRSRIEEAPELTVFLEELTLSYHEPPADPISRSEMTNSEMMITGEGATLDERNVYLEFLEKKELGHVEDALDHYRNGPRLDVENRDKKMI